MSLVMRKLFFILIVSAFALIAGAKVIKITTNDGTENVITSSEVSAIDFNDDGSVTITSWDGTEIIGNLSSFDRVTVSDGIEITEETDSVWEFEYSDLHLYSRPMHRINYVYPSTDPFGNPITLSGIISMPRTIYCGAAKSEGILLFNHYTIFNKDEAPTKGYAQLEGFFMANPLNINYIIVESDFYGFGATVRFPQAYLQGLHNARASLDGLLAARQLLERIGIETGDLTFNVGYSSGGFDALATQKLRDIEYADRISFDKTFAGGSPSDIAECYRQYVLIDSTAYNAVPALLMVATVETQNMDLDYHDVLDGRIADNIDEWINSKSYSSWPVCDSIGREKKVHEILTPPYCDLNSEQCKEILDIFTENSLNHDWTWDPSQRLYLMHSRDDDYVPLSSARNLLLYFQAQGLKPNIVPGKTNFQTNFVVTKLGHLTGTLVYLAQSVAALKAWPLMYTDGELNETYKALVDKEESPVDIMRRLDDMGFDCRAIINATLDYISKQGGEGETGIDLSTLMALLAEQGLDAQTILEMSNDSGVDIVKIVMDFIAYMNETPDDTGDSDDDDDGEPDNDSDADKVSLMIKRSTPTLPDADYEHQLVKWLESNGIR